MGRIFSNTPMEGKPLALRGLARGWRLLEECWERLEVIGGHVEWRNGRNGLIPRIIIDSLSNQGDDETLHVWQIRDIEGVTAMYMPTDSFRVNDKDFTALQTSLTAIGVSYPDWYDISLFATTGLNAYIEYDEDTANNQPGKPISLSLGTDASVAPSGRYLTIPIIAYDATQGLYSLHHSAINYERTSFDGDLASPLFKSLSRPYDDGDWDDEDHTIGINGFMTAVVPDEDPFIETTPERTQHLCVRETNSTGDGADARWYNLRTLIDGIKTVAYDYVELNIDLIYDGSWFDWYDGLDTGQKRFWELGQDESLCYGSAIGNSGSTKVIDLDGQTIIGATVESAVTPWYMTGDFVPTTTATYSLGLRDHIWQYVFGALVSCGELSSLPDENSISLLADLEDGEDIGIDIGTATHPFTDVRLTSTGGVYVGSNKVLGAQGAAVADATGAGDVVAQLNSLLARVRAHGLIAT